MLCFYLVTFILKWKIQRAETHTSKNLKNEVANYGFYNPTINHFLRLYLLFDKRHVWVCKYCLTSESDYIIYCNNDNSIKLTGYYQILDQSYLVQI